LVNIRDEKTLEVKKGCSVWDMGYKIGLNGVDNAALWFDKVRVPRLNLLNATSYIDENGIFSSKVFFLFFYYIIDSVGAPNLSVP
jgi:acyl-CoA oxidase